MNANRISLRQEVKIMQNDIKKLYELVTILAVEIKKIQNGTSDTSIASEESNENKD